jgi:hypothetical protein
MVYKAEKIVGTKRYKVINEETREVKSKYSTRNDAQRQVRLLNNERGSPATLSGGRPQSIEKSAIKWVR